MIGEMGMSLFWCALAVFEDVCFICQARLLLKEEGSSNGVASFIVSNLRRGTLDKSVRHHKVR